MQPVGSSLLGDLAGALTGGLLGGGGAAIPAGRLPLVLFIWGPTRITPVRLKSLTIHETAFDELLNPIHASADLGFTVLRPTISAPTTRSRGPRRPSTRGRARSRPCCRCPSSWRPGEMAAPDPTSRYAGLPDDPRRRARRLGSRCSAPRAWSPRRRSAAPTRFGAGDRLDLLARRSQPATRPAGGCSPTPTRSPTRRASSGRARPSTCPMPDTRLQIEIDGATVADDDLAAVRRGPGGGVGATRPTPSRSPPASSPAPTASGRACSTRW